MAVYKDEEELLKKEPTTTVDKYAGTDYHADAVKAAQAGDWDLAKEMLGMREEKVIATGKNYGKTSMDIWNELQETYGQKKPVTYEAPAYESSYSPQIDSMVNAILNREEFSYDHETDPSYQAYAQQYKRLGDRAREDTLGDIAGLTGGYASSWAASAASQAQNDYNSQLSGIIPELREAAYNRYMDEYNMDVTNLGLLQGLDDRDYSRYRDTVADGQWKTQFDYNVSRDEAEDEKWNTQFNWNKYVDEWNMDNTEATQKFNQLMTKWQTRGYADEEIAKELGVPVGATTESYYFNKLSQQMAQDEFDWKKDTAKTADLLNKWQIMGYADEEVAAGLGVEVGTRTESYKFKEISAAMEQEDRNKANESDNDPLIASIARTASEMASKDTDGYDNAAKYILANVSSADEFYKAGAQAGIPEVVLNEVFDSFYNQALKDSENDVEQDYTYYATLMGQQEDPEAWLASNKWVIPADILEDLYKLLDY